MKSFTLFFLVLALVSGCSKKVLITTSQKDADVFLNGQKVAKGTYSLKLKKDDCFNIKVEKTAYLVDEVLFCNSQRHPSPPKRYYFDMAKDDAFEASVKTDLANVDITIVSTKDETETWKQLVQIITSHFDALETIDKETGYVRTAWSVQTFKQKIVRTRLILKLSSSSPLTYKVKLVSEDSFGTNVSVKDDEKFKLWDRVLRKYDGVIPEIQSRIK